MNYLGQLPLKEHKLCLKISITLNIYFFLPYKIQNN